jgi:transcriptional regulator with XRE-family HTH domain
MIDNGKAKELIARKLFFLRTDRDKSQKQIADRIGISRSRYSMFECGKRLTPYHIIEGVCEYYGITLDEFQKIKIPASYCCTS